MPGRNELSRLIRVPTVAPWIEDFTLRHNGIAPGRGPMPQRSNFIAPPHGPMVFRDPADQARRPGPSKVIAAGSRSLRALVFSGQPRRVNCRGREIIPLKAINAIPRQPGRVFGAFD